MSDKPVRARLVDRRSVREEVEREVAYHVEMRTRELIERGWDPEQARAEAERLFGDPTGVRAECEELAAAGRRSRRRGLRRETLWQDLRFGARVLRRDPGFALVAVLTLALGVGANAAVFSVVRGVLMRPLPYPEPDRLVQVWQVDTKGDRQHLSTANYLDWRELSRSFSSMAVYPGPWGGRTTVLGGSEPVRVWVKGVSSDFFRTLGTAPLRGRTFTQQDGRGPPVAVVSHRFWRRWLGADPDLARHTLRLFGSAYQVVGVMPEGFHFPDETDVWLALRLAPDTGGGRSSHNWRMVARLTSGVTIPAADRELKSIASRIHAVHGDDTDPSAAVVSLQEQLTGPVRTPLLLLLGAAGLVLLVACTNLASTLLARGTAREQELAVRAALGAGRARLVRQLFTESLLLGLLGAVAGLGVGWLLLRGLLAVAPAELPRLGAVRLDGAVAAFTLGLAAITAILFGLFPALRLSFGRLAGRLREGGRGGTARHGGAWRALVAGEVALAVVLLVGSGLLVRSLAGLLAIDPGYDAARALTVEVSLPGSKYASGSPAVPAWYREALEAIRRLPGVREAGLVNNVPLGGVSLNGAVTLEGGELHGAYGNYRVVSDGYFEAMGIPVLRGRAFEDRDREGTLPVALVNASMARRHWPDGSPLGRRFRVSSGMDLSPDEWVTVVGVVGDVHHRSLEAGADREYYLHYGQRSLRISAATLVIGTEGRPPEELIGPVRDLLRRLDPDVPAEFVTMEERVSASVADRRFAMLVLAAFAALGLTLAAVGIYGVVSYSVARRTREIGIRMALGAEPWRVLALVSGESMRAVAGGVLAGSILALAAARLLRGLLYGVEPADPLTFAAAIVLLLLVGWVAGLVPAVRATRVDPTRTMRAE